VELEDGLPPNVSDVFGKGVVDSDLEVAEDRHRRSVDRTNYCGDKARAREGFEQLADERSSNLRSQLTCFELL